MAPSHFTEHMLQNGLLVSRPAPSLIYNKECLLAWNKENMGGTTPDPGLAWQSGNYPDSG